MIIIEKKYEELNITDAFMFSKIMRDEKICKPVLEEILQIKIKKIEYLDYEETLKITGRSKGIRMDIYVEDEEHTVYNLEMQSENTGNIPKRSRYYQSVIDLNLLEKGEDYDTLKTSIVIFICTFDLFGKGECVYTFENQCQEVSELRLKDETKKIFLNTKGKHGNISSTLRDLLSYMDGKKPKEVLAKRIDEKVVEARDNVGWRREYMSLYVELRDKYKEGYDRGEMEGYDRGTKEMNELILKLAEQGRNQDIVRIAEDKEYREKLMKELEILK